ncbi:MAG: transporter substrate-binding domain-containing protein, partial [Thiotrichales bacterium]|nr:transporter substrate-binding domain-containing protein [Thiotrichales bacterium]
MNNNSTTTARSTATLPHVLAICLWLMLALLFRDGQADVVSHHPETLDTVSAATVSDPASPRLNILYHRRFQNSYGVSITEQRLIEAFASEQGLNPVWIELAESWQLLPALIEGRGDVIIGQGDDLNAGIADDIRKLEPWAVSMQQVVARQDSARINKLQDLAFRQVALKQSSPVWDVIEDLKQQQAGMDIVMIPESMPEQEILERVEIGQYDVAVLDSLYLKDVLAQHDALAVVYSLSDPKPMVWAVREEAGELHLALNTYLKKYLLALNLTDVAREDLPVMQEKRSIRLITYQSPTNLYYKNGEIVGFEYKLLKRFARQNAMRVDLVIADSHDEMKTLLLEGKGDVIAASLPRQSVEDGNDLAY